MDDTFSSVWALYPDEDAPPRSGADLREQEALAEVKRALDARPRLRPSRAALDAVFLAAEKPRSAGPRADRGPRPRMRNRRIPLYSLTGAAFAFLIALSIGVWRLAPEAGLSPAASTPHLAAPEAPPAAELAAAPAPRAEQTAPAAPARPQPAAPEAAARLAAARPAEASVRPATAEEARQALEAGGYDWDEADEVYHLHRRVELLEARSAEAAWDEEDLMPAPPSGRNLPLVQPASMRQF